MPKDKRKRKSAKRVARGKKLAKTLPRDAKGKFLPRGSKNLFRKKKGTRKRIRRRSAKRRKAPAKRSKLRRTKSLPSLSARMTRRGKSLTTDLFPNFLSGSLSETGADVFTTTQVFTPIPRLKTIGNRATVMEILYIDVVINTTLNAAAESVLTQFVIGTTPTGALAFQDPRVFAHKQIFNFFVTSGMYALEMPLRIDLTTQDGFGFLLASDSFHVIIDGTATGVVNVVRWKMFYRFVNIPLAEFIGIVQSTQQS